LKQFQRLDLTCIAGAALRGAIAIPGDKSISHRALILAAIAQGSSRFHNLLLGQDNRATLNALSALGVDIQIVGAEVFVQGRGLHGLRAPDGPLDCGNSGTAMRLLCGLLSSQAFDSELIGDDSLMKRPMRRIIEPLSRMGAVIESSQGSAPLRIKGGQRLQAIDYQIPVASAQVKSCLLLAAMAAEGVTCLREPRQTRDHTERLLQGFGYPLTQQHQQLLIPGGGMLKAYELVVPGDLSSAAFFIVAATLIPGSDVVLKQVGINPTRFGIITLLREMGADIEVLQTQQLAEEPVADLRVRYAKLKGITIDPALVPLAIDEFPALFIAAACARGITTLRGAAELRVKESDRLKSMAAGLVRLGINVTLLPDGLVIRGGKLCGGNVESAGDHRIAMAFAIAGGVASAPICVRDCANIATSYPNFVESARALGFSMHVAAVY